MSLITSISKQVKDIKTNELSYRELHDSAIIKDTFSNRNIEIPFNSITNKYKNFLSKIIVEKTLTEHERLKYKYKPKLLSQDLYSTTEYWNDLLILNNFYSVLDFIPEKTIKIYNKNELKEYLNEILILEDKI